MKKHDLGTTSVDRVPRCFSYQDTMIDMSQVQKWTILEKDFSIPGGELGKKNDMLCSAYYKGFSDVYVIWRCPCCQEDYSDGSKDLQELTR